MTSAQRAYRARVFAEVNRTARRRSAPLAGLSSITWGTRARGLGTMLDTSMFVDTRPPIVSPLNSATEIVGPFPIPTNEPPPIVPFPGNPDTRPGAWPGLTFTNPLVYPGNEPPPIVVPASGAPGQVPVVTTPTSGPIPPPATVAAGTAATSWLDQSLIGGIANKWLLLGGIGAFVFLGGKRK